MASKGLRISTQPVAGWHFRTFLSFGLRSPFSFYRVCLELGRLTIGVLEAFPYDYCKARRSWPAREDSSTRELASPKLVSATAHTQQCDWRCELAINESKKMAALARREQLAALARSEHERAARSLPAAALPQRAFSENTTKRDIPTFVRARIRDFEALRECVVILAAEKSSPV